MKKFIMTEDTYSTEEGDVITTGKIIIQADMIAGYRLDIQDGRSYCWFGVLLKNGNWFDFGEIDKFEAVRIQTELDYIFQERTWEE